MNRSGVHRSRNLTRLGWVASLAAAVLGLGLLSTARADIAPLDLDALRRDGPSPSCPEGSDDSPLVRVDCVPTAVCTSDAQCGESGPCQQSALCLAPARGGVRPVLGACLQGACERGECDTARRCLGSPRSRARRAAAQVEQQILDSLGEPGEAPIPEPDGPDTERSLHGPPPAPAAATSSGCGCRGSKGPSASGSLTLILAFLWIRPARRR